MYRLIILFICVGIFFFGKMLYNETIENKKLKKIKETHDLNTVEDVDKYIESLQIGLELRKKSAIMDSNAYKAALEKIELKVKQLNKIKILIENE